MLQRNVPGTTKSLSVTTWVTELLEIVGRVTRWGLVIEVRPVPLTRRCRLRLPRSGRQPSAACSSCCRDPTRCPINHQTQARAMCYTVLELSGGGRVEPLAHLNDPLALVNFNPLRGSLQPPSSYHFTACE